MLTTKGLIMKSLNLVLFISVVFIIMFSSAISADQNQSVRVRQLTGLWEGIDPGDGSLTQRQITCDRVGNCLVLGSDSFWSFCGSDRGLLRGEGFIDDGVLNVPDFTLTCTEVDRAIGANAVFSLDLRNRTLVEETDNPNIPSITFHKTSW